MSSGSANRGRGRERTPDHRPSTPHTTETDAPAAPDLAQRSPARETADTGWPLTRTTQRSTGRRIRRQDIRRPPKPTPQTSAKTSSGLTHVWRHGCALTSARLAGLQKSVTPAEAFATRLVWNAGSTLADVTDGSCFAEGRTIPTFVTCARSIQPQDARPFASIAPANRLRRDFSELPQRSSAATAEVRRHSVGGTTGRQAERA
jgi:hypothetical protein